MSTACSMPTAARLNRRQTRLRFTASSGLAFAYLVTSDIAHGCITGFDLRRAKAVPLVLDILTHETVGNQVKVPLGPDGGPTTTTLESNRIWHDGQIIAVVIADTFGAAAAAAAEAAGRVQVSTVAEPVSASFGALGIEVQATPAAGHGEKAKENPKAKKAAADAAFAEAPVKVDARYGTPPQHHNPMELLTTTCVWDGSNLTVYEPSQLMWGGEDGNRPPAWHRARERPRCFPAFSRKECTIELWDQTSSCAESRQALQLLCLESQQSFGSDRRC
jgi:CO/xanthine dehydrogenase Mo-binding subunit